MKESASKRGHVLLRSDVVDAPVPRPAPPLVLRPAPLLQLLHLLRPVLLLRLPGAPRRPPLRTGAPDAVDRSPPPPLTPGVLSEGARASDPSGSLLRITAFPLAVADDALLLADAPSSQARRPPLLCLCLDAPPHHRGRGRGRGCQGSRLLRPALFLRLPGAPRRPQRQTGAPDAVDRSLPPPSTPGGPFRGRARLCLRAPPHRRGRGRGRGCQGSRPRDA